MQLLNKNLINTQHPHYQNPKYAPVTKCHSENDKLFHERKASSQLKYFLGIIIFYLDINTCPKINSLLTYKKNDQATYLCDFQHVLSLPRH